MGADFSFCLSTMEASFAGYLKQSAGGHQITQVLFSGGPSFRALCEKVGPLNCDFSASVFIVVKQHQH
jgi:hypothetical protein